MKKKKNKIPGHRNPFVRVMNERHLPGNTRFKNRNEKRQNNSKNNWQKDWE